MDIILFIISALITIIWSVWVYTMWEQTARLPEEATLRYLLLIAPSMYIFILAVSTWVRSLFIRLDIIGLLSLDVVTLIAGVALFAALHSGKNSRKIYLTTIGAYHAAAILIIGFLYVIRLYPPLLIRISSYMRQLEELRILRMDWVALNPENYEQDIPGLINKIIIALFSYIPISVLRIIYMGRQRKKLEKNFDALRKKVETLEKDMTNRHAEVEKIPSEVLY